MTSSAVILTLVFWDPKSDDWARMFSHDPQGPSYFFSIEIQKCALVPAFLWGFELRSSGLCNGTSRLSHSHHSVLQASQCLVLEPEHLSDFAARVVF